MIIVSACLCGINTRYDGKSSLDYKVLELLKSGKAIPVCPEQLGGLTTPRLPCEINGGTGKDVLIGKARIVDKEGNNLTEQFVKGANEVINICKVCSIKTAILKSKSPSCGYGKIYDGSFSGNAINGNGVFAQLLIENNIEVIEV
ncbi:DUF523 domain-containing protein [Clostridium tyrobutyricum]|jgi:uncharacterized protein YbbK (DUF523 family)|uniref:Uncharacterized protein n=1 Tax=Clostridium tyrobutyricum DIVETGP TaxID=1408889 RepID=W6N3I7_CLOTY|nr:DUF523 domain-containing protein [Clostridium tyrobutyricum]AND84120.1 hypothetical protein CTK_C08590 [Clostridium tyrobutyricum]ANP68847.1 hypothetical protein BA182_03915 [Clostridium tyrobutyricum]MBR9649286.1 DUF523 domain-containing protein [Clostridium tyrobutyricum]MBV4415845.1 DUF523 domain-containing protein [Clostridium tyrobutyricum]MBV4421890.1 DUF523 domain-containing protein [Clostridium tyrobutyricum]